MLSSLLGCLCCLVVFVISLSLFISGWARHPNVCIWTILLHWFVFWQFYVCSDFLFYICSDCFIYAVTALYGHAMTVLYMQWLFYTCSDSFIYAVTVFYIYMRCLSTFRSNSCPSCDTKFPTCIVTGRPLMEYQFWMCSACKHRAYESDIAKQQNCPLCHTPVWT